MPKGVYKHKPLSEEHKKNISEHHKKNGVGRWAVGNKNALGKHWKLSDETRMKMSNSKKGIIPKNVKDGVLGRLNKGKKTGRIPKTAFKKGNIPWCKGKKRLDISGEKHPNWQGGIFPYPDDWTDNLRDSIRKRDNYVCQECGIHQEELIGWHKKLDVHHKDYNKDNLNPENLISLCRSCHTKTNFNREYWINYFNN